MALDQISIIIPVYNAERFLSECLTSVLSQDVPSLRIVVIDDGSTDSTPEILNCFAFQHKNLHIIQTQNFGPSHARNTGLDMVVGHSKYIAFCDADDILEEGYLQTLLAKAEEGFDVVCSSFSYYSNKGRRPFNGMNPVFGDYSAFEATRFLLEDRTVQSHSPCKLYRGDLWKGIRFPENVVLMEDQGTVYKTFIKARKISFIKNYGYLYRQTGQSICSSPVTNSKVLDALEGYSRPAKDSFSGFGKEQANVLRGVALQSFANTFLMMLPRFNAKKATKQEKERLKSYKRFATKRLAIIRFKPKTKTERMKKWAYLLLKPFYKKLFVRFSGKTI